MHDRYGFAVMYMSQSRTFAAGGCHHQGKYPVCREEERVLSRPPQTAAYGLVRGSLHCVREASSRLSSLGLLPCICHDAACGGKTDGWGVRACAVALTVGKDLCTLSIRGKCEEKFCIFANSKKLTIEKESLLTGFYGFHGSSVPGSD